MAKVLRFIVNIFLIVTILGAVVILVPPLLGVTTTIVDTETMDTNLPLGSITYSKDISVADIQPGDKILKETSTSTYLYVIQSGDLAKGTYQAINGTKANAEPEEIVLRNNVSRVVLTIPFIGYVLVAMHSMEGLIIIGLVLIFMIVLFILSELWKKDDDYDEEDEDDEYDDDEYDDETEADVVDIKNKGKNMSRKDRKEAKKQAALKEKQRAKKAKEQAKQEKREAKRAKKQAAYDEEFEAFYADGTKDEEEAWTRPVYIEESDDVLPVRPSAPELSETGTLLDTREIELRELEAQLGIVKEEASVEVSEDFKILEEAIELSEKAEERTAVSEEAAPAEDAEEGIVENIPAAEETVIEESIPEAAVDSQDAAASEGTAGETETDTDDGTDKPVVEQVDSVVEEVVSVKEPAAETKVAAPVAPVKKAWTCSCGATATGKFCPMCGSPKPVEDTAAVSAESAVEEVTAPSINIEDVAKAVEASAVATEAAAVEAAVAEDIQPAKIDEDGSFVPVERLTLDELIEEAEKNHESPRLIKDSDTGITLVDYTDII